MNKKCLGWHCPWRDKCEHHGVPGPSTQGFFQPQRTGEFCDHFQDKRNFRDEYEGED